MPFSHILSEVDLVCLNPPYLPRFSRYSRSPCVSTSGTLYYPLMECMAAAYVEKSGFKARVIDAVAKDMSKGQVVDLIEGITPRYIAVATSTPSVLADILMAEELKARLPQATVIMVGRHASWAPEETLRLCSRVDGVVRGEYYRACVDLLNGKPLSEVKGAAFKSNGAITVTEEEKPLDPDEIPLISPVIKRDLGTREYFYASLKNPYTMLQHSWGCSHNCDFCDEYYKSSYRHRGTDVTIHELMFIAREMPEVKEVLFDDPTFVINEGHTEELCKAMIDSKIRLSWSCNLRCSVSLETLKLMRAAGCRLAHVGVESLTQEGKDSIHKKLSLERERQFLMDAKKAGILIHGCFIVGLPAENAGSVRQTLDKAKRLPFDTVQVFPLIPTPNTPSWRWAEDNNFLVTKDFASWLRPDGSYACVVSRPDFTAGDVDRWVGIFIKEFYLRPSYVIYKLLQSLKSWQEMKRNLASGLNLFRRLKRFSQ
ncbi:MAG: radical SAM protein [Chloroflexi bacterium]|nr:radical SAM protein [Chloroflexota bacterium]